MKAPVFQRNVLSINSLLSLFIFEFISNPEETVEFSLRFDHNKVHPEVLISIAESTCELICTFWWVRGQNKAADVENLTNKLHLVIINLDCLAILFLK